jgi:hypothetical protein
MLYGIDAKDFKHINMENIDIKAVDEAALKFTKQLTIISEEDVVIT